MLSKLLRPTIRNTAKQLLVRKVSPKFVLVRHMDLIPASQYDTVYPKKFYLPYALKTYPEIIPLLFCTFVGVIFVLLSTMWAVQTKVSVNIYTVNI